MNVKNICFILCICLILLSVGSVSAFNETKTFDIDLVNGDSRQSIEVEHDDIVTVNVKTAEVEITDNTISAKSIHDNSGERESVYLKVGEINNGNIIDSKDKYYSSYDKHSEISMEYNFEPLTSYQIQYYLLDSASTIHSSVHYGSTTTYTEMLYEGVITTDENGNGGVFSTIMEGSPTTIKSEDDTNLLSSSLFLHLGQNGYYINVNYKKTPIYTTKTYTDTKIVKSKVLDKTFKKVKLFRSEYKLFKKMIKGKYFNPYKFSKIIKVKNYKLDKTYSYKILNLKKLSKKYNVANGKKEVRYKFTVKRYHTISKTVKKPYTVTSVNYV